MNVFIGILQVSGEEFVGLNHIARLGHAILGMSLVWFMILLKKSLKKYIIKHTIKKDSLN